MIARALSIISLLLILSNLAGFTFASEYTGAQLLEPCVEGDNASRWGAVSEIECEQYLIGFSDAIQLMTTENGEQSCLPAINRADEMRWAFVYWAHQHYDDLNLPAGTLLIRVIREAFPCN